MAHRILDRVQETTLGTGTGALTLAGGTSKMLGLSAAGFANGDTFWGLIEHATAAEWEIALCTFSAGAITRATPLKSSTGATVSFSAGTKTVSLVAPASKTPLADNNGTFIFTGPVDLQGMRESFASPAISAGSLSLDLSAASVFKVANNANVTTLNIQNATANKATSFMLQLTADGVARTWTWPASVTWISGVPTLTSVSGKADLFVFFTLDGGTTWLGSVVAQNY